MMVWLYNNTIVADTYTARGVAQQSDRRWYRRWVSFSLFHFYLYHRAIRAADFVICSLDVLTSILMWLMEIGD